MDLSLLGAVAATSAADPGRREGRSLGPLHGIPAGVRDSIAAHDMPTEDGAVLHAGRRPH